MNFPCPQSSAIRSISYINVYTLVWGVTADIHFLDNDDLCVVAMVAELLNMKSIGY